MLHSLTTRRAFMISTAALGATTLNSALSHSAYADTYPSRPVRVVLPLGPGGVGDISARIVADKLSDKLGQRFFIENQPSPDGLVAGHTVLNAEPDGYTLFLVTGGITSSIPQYKEFPLDMNSFVPISSIGYFDCVRSRSSSTWRAAPRCLCPFSGPRRECPWGCNLARIWGRRVCYCSLRPSWKRP